MSMFPAFFTDDTALAVRGAAPAGELGPSISVLVWNVYKRQRPNWPDRFSHLVHKRDLVLLQESTLGPNPDPVFAPDGPMEWVMAQSFMNRQTKISTGVKTGSAVQSTGRRFFRSPDREPVLNTPKMLLATIYPLRGSASGLLVLNMHALNFVSQRKFMRHVDMITGAVAGHAGPVIAAGDFNTWNKTRYDYLIDVTERAGLSEAKFSRVARLAHFNRHLDHVFYRGLTLDGIETPDRGAASDHDPIALTFSCRSG